MSRVGFDDPMLFAAWTVAMHGLMRTGEFTSGPHTTRNGLVLRNRHLSPVTVAEGIRLRKVFPDAQG